MKTRIYAAAVVEGLKIEPDKLLTPICDINMYLIDNGMYWIY